MYQVLGIGLVVEHSGIVSLVLRYPATPPSVSPHRAQPPSEKTPLPSSRASNKAAGSISSHHQHKEHLFFSLPSRVLAKLFRPKPPLCGRPLTIQLGEESLFCCHSVLLREEDDSRPSSSGTSTKPSAHEPDLKEMTMFPPSSNMTERTRSFGDEEHVAMFSVVVALAPHEIVPRSIPRSGMCQDFSYSPDVDANYVSKGSKEAKKATVRAPSPPLTSSMGPMVPTSEAPKMPSDAPARNLKRSASTPTAVGTSIASRAATTLAKLNDTKRNEDFQSSSSIQIIGSFSRSRSDAREPSFSSPPNNNRQGEPESMGQDEYHIKHHNILQRVHRSLARICRVLDKEEQRSRYVSRQTKELLQIRDDFIMKLQHQPPLLLFPVNATLNPSSPMPRYRSGDSSGLCDKPLLRSSSSMEGGMPYHNPTFDMSSSSHAAAAAVAAGSPSTLLMDQAEKDRLIDEHRQSTLECMLAACPDNNNTDSGTGGGHKEGDRTEDGTVNNNTTKVIGGGNLARDLAQVYHALAKHDIHSRHDDRGLTGVQERASPVTSHITIVHINNHKSVPVEAVTNPSEILIEDAMFRFSNQVHHSLLSSHHHHHHPTVSHPKPQQQPQTKIQHPNISTTTSVVNTRQSMPASSCRQYIRSYHTLLFPKLSAEELLQNLENKIAAAPPAPPPVPGSGKGTKRVGLRPGTNLKSSGTGSRSPAATRLSRQHGRTAALANARARKVTGGSSSAAGSGSRHGSAFGPHRNKTHNKAPATAEELKSSTIYHILSNITYFKSFGDIVGKETMFTAATATGPQTSTMMVPVQRVLTVDGGSANSNISMTKILDTAARLVDSGLCRLAPAITLKTRFAIPPMEPCSSSGKRSFMDRLPSTRLKFAKHFGTTVPLLTVVGIFSSGRPLGDVIQCVLNGGDYTTMDRSSLRSGIAGVEMKDDPMSSSGSYQLLLEQISNSVSSRMDQFLSFHEFYNESMMTAPEHEELVREELCSMAVWLRANECLVEIKDYLIAVEPMDFTKGSSSRNRRSRDEDKKRSSSCDVDTDEESYHNSSSPSQLLDHRRKMYAREDTWADSPDIVKDHDSVDPSSSTDPPLKLDEEAKAEGTTTSSDPKLDTESKLDSMEYFYNELREAGALDGHISVEAICWRLEIDPSTLRKLIAWGRQHKRITVVTRPHDNAVDDWGAP